MKILFLAPQPFFVERGTPIAVRFAVEALCRAGHNVDLVVLHDGEDIAMPGLTLHRAAKPPFIQHVPIGMSPAKLACDLSLAATACGLLLKRRYDVVHAVEESIFPALIARMMLSFKLVYDMDSLLGEQIVEKWPGLSFIRPLLRAIEGWPMRRADLVLPVCPAIAERVVQHAPRQNVHLLPDVAPDVSGTSDDKTVLNLRTLVADERPIALYVGNLEHYQGVDLLIGAMAQIADPACCSLVIVGGSDAGITAARALAERRGVARRVHLTGPAPLSHLPHLLEQADILCSPRVTGVNTPMKIYGYMQAGRAILATRIVSHTQVLSASSARLVEPDERGMAQALFALAADAPGRAALGAAAKEASRDYTFAAFERRLRSAYATLCLEERAQAHVPSARTRSSL